MSWEDLPPREVIRHKLPASIRFKVDRPKARAHCIVTLRKSFADEIGWKYGDLIRVQIGKGDSAGLLRFIRNGIPARTIARKITDGGIYFNLGYVERLGTERARAVPCDAKKINDDIIEIVLPAALASAPRSSIEESPAGDAEDETEIEDEADEDEEQIEEEAPRPSRREELRPEKPDAPFDILKTKYGISIDLTSDAEKISFRGKETEITSNQGLFFRYLLDALGTGKLVAPGFLCKKIFGHLPEKRGEEALKVVVGDSKQAAKTIGLEVKTVSGIGYSLVIP